MGEWMDVWMDARPGLEWPLSRCTEGRRFKLAGKFHQLAFCLLRKEPQNPALHITNYLQPAPGKRGASRVLQLTLGALLVGGEGGKGRDEEASQRKAGTMEGREGESRAGAGVGAGTGALFRRT